MKRRCLLFSIIVFFTANLYSQSFMEIIENYNLFLGNKISEYDYNNMIKNNVTRYLSLTDNNQIDELIRLNINNLIIDITINSNRIITKVSSEDINIVGPSDLKIGDDISTVFSITNDFYYNNGYLELYAKINSNLIIVFGENDKIKAQNLPEGYYKNGAFVVTKQKPSTLDISISEHENMKIKCFIYQNITENNIYYTRIMFN